MRSSDRRPPAVGDTVRVHFAGGGVVRGEVVAVRGTAVELADGLSYDLALAEWWEGPESWHLILHKGPVHPERPAARRWFVAPSGAAYWLELRGDAWEIFTPDGVTVARGVPSLADVQSWALAGEVWH